MRKKRGFTLIELLIVIAIIGVLATIVMAALNSSRIKARNARRDLDVRQIKNALTLYYDDHQCYPDCSGMAVGMSSNVPAEWSQLKSYLSPYISTLPTDPVNTNQNIYVYQSDHVNADYTLTYKYEGMTPVAAAPVYRGGGGVNTNNPTSVTVTTSAIAQSGDLIILIGTTDSATGTFSWPAGFTENPVTISCTADGQAIRFAYKIAGASEPASYVIGHSGGSYTGGAVLVYSGVDPIAPFDVSPTARVVNSLSQPLWSVTASGVSAGTANRLLVMVTGIDNVSPDTVSATVPSASPGTWTTRVDTGTVSGGSNLAIFDTVDPDGSFTGNKTSFQLSPTSPNAGQMAFMIALKPQQ